MEQKASPDLVWPIADTLLRGRLGYEQSLRTSLVNLITAPGRSVHIDYPFELANGQELTLPIWLFSTGDLRRAFDAAGLEIADTLGIHQLTNLIPSTLLHRTPPDRTVQRLFERIRTGERRLAKLWPFRRLGSSIVYHLTRRQPPAYRTTDHGPRTCSTTRADSHPRRILEELCNLRNRNWGHRIGRKSSTPSASGRTSSALHASHEYGICTLCADADGP